MPENDTLVRVENVSKKFCKSLKRSFWYGMCDTARELNPFAVQSSKLKVEGDSPTCNLQPSTDFDLPSLRKDEFWAVRNVSFELKRGECLGLIGKNGAGKSTLLKILNGLIKPNTGRIEMHGRIGALIELGAGFNPILTGRENIYNKGAILGFTKADVQRKFDEIVAFAEVEDFIDMPVQNYSSGMKVRLGFAVSAMMEPDVLIIDEVLAVGDIGFRIKCMNRINELLQNACVIFVSHAMPHVAKICTSMVLLDKGGIRYQGDDVAAGIEQYLEYFGMEESTVLGPGKVVLDAIALHSVNAAPDDAGLAAIQQNDNACIVMDVSACEKINPFRITITIIDQQLRTVACIVPESNDEDAVLSLQVNERRHVEVRFRCVLAPGIYSLNIGFSEYLGAARERITGEHYGQHKAALTFRVGGSQRFTHTPIHLLSGWQMT
jgi:lipopolysaccharide transport system ATP-binding protein